VLRPSPPAIATRSLAGVGEEEQGGPIITLSEFILGVLGILVLLLSYLVELAYHVLCNAGFPL
jgi:hypothetical protein